MHTIPGQPNKAGPGVIAHERSFALGQSLQRLAQQRLDVALISRRGLSQAGDAVLHITVRQHGIDRVGHAQAARRFAVPAICAGPGNPRRICKLARVSGRMMQTCQVSETCEVCVMPQVRQGEPLGRQSAPRVVTTPPAQD
jgi:hypothetical protein